MISVEQARKIEPLFVKLGDEQILDILKDMYDLSQLAFEKWAKNNGSKNPKGLLFNSTKVVK